MCQHVWRSNKDSWHWLCEEAIRNKSMSEKLSIFFVFSFFTKQYQTFTFTFTDCFQSQCHLRERGDSQIRWIFLTESQVWKVFSHYSGRQTTLAASFWWQCGPLDITSRPVFLSSSVWTGACVITSLQKGSLHRMQCDT